MQSVASDFFSLFRRWHTWFLMANQDIQLRYRRSLIGPFWISVAMATTIGGISLLYSEVMHVSQTDLVAWLGSGLPAWVLLSSMIAEGCGLIPENESHLRGVPLPIPTLAARVVYRNLVIFGHNMVVILPMLVLLGVPLKLTVFAALAGLLLYLPFGWFVAILLGPVCARFRDVTQVVGSIMQLLFFFTPIFWKPDTDMMSPLVKSVVQYNPLYHMVQLVRAPIVGELPTALNWQMSLAATAVVAALSFVSLAMTRRSVYLWI